MPRPLCSNEYEILEINLNPQIKEGVCLRKEEKCINVTNAALCWK